MFKRYISMVPEYEFKNLTHEQFKTLRDYMIDNYDSNDCEFQSKKLKDYIRHRGGKLSDNWYFVLCFNYIGYDYTFRKCNSIEESISLMLNIISYMDTIANDLNELLDHDENES